MQAGVQEELPRGADGQALHRGDAQRQDRHHLRGAVYWMRYLCQGKTFHNVFHIC